jgi:hypothetical protein
LYTGVSTGLAEGNLSFTVFETYISCTEDGNTALYFTMLLYPAHKKAAL